LDRDETKPPQREAPTAEPVRPAPPPRRGGWLRGKGPSLLILGAVLTFLALVGISLLLLWRGARSEETAGVVGATDPGSPAWKKGIPAEATLLRVGDVEHPSFVDLKAEVMRCSGDESFPITYRDPRTKNDVTVDLTPRKLRTERTPIIGIMPAFSTQFVSRRFGEGGLSHPVIFQSAGARAEPPLEFGDRIVGTTDPADPARIHPLPADTRLRTPKGGNPEKPREAGDYAEFARRLRLLAGKEVTLRVERGDAEGKRQLLDIKIPPAYHVTLGARMEMGQITAVREGSPGDKSPDRGGVQLPAVKDVHGRSIVLQGDVIESVEVKRPDGRLLRFGNAPARGGDPAAVEVLPLDPARLPDQLREWAREVAEKKPNEKREVRLQVRRHNHQDVRQFQAKILRLEWEGEWEDNVELPMGLASPLSIPGLGLAYQIQTTVAAAEGQGKPADLQPGDVIKKYRFAAIVNDQGETETGSWVELGPDQWARVFFLLQQLPNITEMYLQVERAGQTRELTLTPRPIADWPLADRGLVLEYDLRAGKGAGLLGYRLPLLGALFTALVMLALGAWWRGRRRGPPEVEQVVRPVPPPDPRS
jgi:regulator of sigma E protease